MRAFGDDKMAKFSFQTWINKNHIQCLRENVSRKIGQHCYIDTGYLSLVLWRWCRRFELVLEQRQNSLLYIFMPRWLCLFLRNPNIPHITGVWRRLGLWLGLWVAIPHDGITFHSRLCWRRGGLLREGSGVRVWGQGLRGQLEDGGHDPLHGGGDPLSEVLVLLTVEMYVMR